MLTVKKTKLWDPKWTVQKSSCKVAYFSSNSDHHTEVDLVYLQSTAHCNIWLAVVEPLLSPELSVLSHRRISEEKNVTAVSTLMARAKYGLNKQKREVRTSQCGEKMHRSNKKSWSYVLKKAFGIFSICCSISRKTRLIGVASHCIVFSNE